MLRKSSSYPLDQSPFFNLTTKRKLAKLLGLPLTNLKSLASAHGLYREFYETKKDDGKRLIESPRQDLKAVQKRMAQVLSRIRPQDYLYCPVKGRCYISNAGRHRGNRVVRCLDIRRYFPETPAWRIHRFFVVVMRCEADVADILTRIATYKGHLPTGSPSSPILAYYAYLDVWERIAEIAKSHGWILTVYVDDVTISGAHVRAQDMWAVRRAIHACGLRAHKEKFYVDSPAEVTGVVVTPKGVRAPHRQHQKRHNAKRRLSALTGTARNDPTLQSSLRGLDAQIRQIGSLNDAER